MYTPRLSGSNRPDWIKALTVQRNRERGIVLSTRPSSWVMPKIGSELLNGYFKQMQTIDPRIY